MKHTKTPWAVKHHGDVCSEVLDDEALAVAFVWGTQGQPNQANARHIVKCVNLHDDLAAACEAALADLVWVTKKLSCTPGVTLMSDFRSICKLEAALAEEKEAKT